MITFYADSNYTKYVCQEGTRSECIMANKTKDTRSKEIKNILDKISYPGR